MPIKIIPSPPPAPNSKFLPVAHVLQKKSQWCWAACAQMVLEYHGQNVSQCKLASALLGSRWCCFLPMSCNSPCTATQVSALYNSFGLGSTHQSNQVSFDTIKSEIDADQPVEVGFEWIGGGGHLAIVRGWEQNSLGDWIRINDPVLRFYKNYGQGTMLYSKLAKPYGIGDWVATWTDLK